MRRIALQSVGLLAFTFAAITAQLSPAVACKLAPPLRQEAGESGEAFELRRKADEAERNKTPEQLELEKQARLWGEADMVFVGRIDAIKVKGKTYPSPKKQLVYSRKRAEIPPLAPPPEPIMMLPFEGGGEVQIRSVRLLKGTGDYKTSWHYVGGMDSCGRRPDGALGFVFPNDELIIFASSQDIYQNVGGREVTSKRRNLYGLNFDEVRDQRLSTVLAGSDPAQAAPP